MNDSYNSSKQSYYKCGFVFSLDASALQGTFRPEPWPDQEALTFAFTFEGEILTDLRKEHKSALKRRGNLLKLHEMRINE